MIPDKYLNLLMSFSKMGDDGYELDMEIAPDEIKEIAKIFYWKPYNKVDGMEYQL